MQAAGSENAMTKQTGPSEYKMCFLTKLVSIASVGGLLFGYDTGVVSGAILYLEDDFPDIDERTIELVVSIALFGAFFASLASGPLSDSIGRKWTIIISDILFALGSLMMAIAPNIPTLMAGRLVVGIGVGIASMIVPMYISEIAPNQVRGAMVATTTCMITLG